MFLDKVQKNRRLKELTLMIADGRFNLDLPRFNSEINALHLNKKLRSLKLIKKGVFEESQAAIIEAINDNMAVRSRIVEIKMQCFRVKTMLEQHIASLKPYLRNKYLDMLRKEYRTETERNSVIDLCFGQSQNIINELDSVIELADIAIDDCDNSSWAVKHIIDALTINGKGRETI